MSLFICEKCHCIENTAFGWYWCRYIGKEPWFGSEYKDLEGKALCSECAPPQFAEGKQTGFGKWHGRFEKKTYEEWGKPDVLNLEVLTEVKHE